MHLKNPKDNDADDFSSASTLRSAHQSIRRRISGYSEWQVHVNKVSQVNSLVDFVVYIRSHHGGVDRFHG